MVKHLLPSLPWAGDVSRGIYEIQTGSTMLYKWFNILKKAKNKKSTEHSFPKRWGLRDDATFQIHTQHISNNLIQPVSSTKIKQRLHMLRVLKRKGLDMQTLVLYHRSAGMGWHSLVRWLFFKSWEGSAEWNSPNDHWQIHLYHLFHLLLWGKQY